MQRLKNPLDALFFLSVVTAFLYRTDKAASVVVPSTSCYALDNSSHLYDFSSWVGENFEYDGKDAIDFVVRFCKDVERRSKPGYVDFGKYHNLNYFVAGSGRYHFVQEFHSGDLFNCETSYDKLGRTAQVNIICGACPNGRQCKPGLGCICNMTLEENCRVLLDLAISCQKQGSRVFEGFTVGFHPRSWEVVYNGMTQLGFEKSYREFSFTTEQTYVTLYMTAIASLSGLVGHPTVEVLPAEGLEVKLSGSAASGTPPTTLSPTLLNVYWRCEIARDTPYEVQVTIPVEGYDPIQFSLAKYCVHRQEEGGKATRGWAVFGIISCIFILISVVFCCGSFVYNTRVGNQRGLDALPGMSVVAACLETLSGGLNSYRRPEEQASWTRQPEPFPGSSNVRYGSI